MTIEVTTEVNYDVDDIIYTMSKKEKLDMYNTLATEFGSDMEKFFASKSAYDQKKILCNALNVGSYCDDQALRKALEKIIKA